MSDQASRPTTVLVVDDYAAARKAFCFIVKSFGPDAVGAGDGEEALTVAASARPDLVFCDIRMPRLNGFEFLKRLREIPGLESVPVVAMSGVGSDVELAAISSAGFAGHLKKPVQSETIAECLRRHLPGG